MINEKVRTRFAPSPTGYLHVGGARTALFSWLVARNQGGKFILRIEDTDISRSTEEAVEAIIDSMAWLGLDWDEGPLRQTERLALYKEAADKLLATGDAYYCYCLPEELEERRQAAKASGETPAYDRRCLGLSKDECGAFETAGRRPVIRFRSADEGQTAFTDIIRGEVIFENDTLDDLVIVRSDSIPTYNFAVVVDDADLSITHVIRGEDHLSNTPRQIQIYLALGYPLPKFAHLPLILGEDKALLSKRHGAASVGTYRDQGYLPEAMVNYLALLGWSYDEKTTLFDIGDLVEKFSLERVGKAPAVFDPEKLKWMNGTYIRELTDGELARRLVPFWIDAGLMTDDALDLEGMPSWLTEIAKICKERLTVLADILPLSDFFFKEEIEYDPAAVEKGIIKSEAASALPLVAGRLVSLSEWQVDTIEEALRTLAAELGVKPGKLFVPIRTAITGRSISPPLFETIWLLGRERVLKRIEAAERLKKRLPDGDQSEQDKDNR